jgi:hypothetical protein
MKCALCGSTNQAEFSTEMAIHFDGLKNLDTPHVFIVPKALVCLDCGLSRFDVPETELQPLREAKSAGFLPAVECLR